MKNKPGQNKSKQQSVSQAFFSVIITTYNRANLITRAIESLISQSEKDWEAIIIDDGSTDNTYFRIEPLIRSFNNIRYVIQPHCGLVAAKNTGVRSARGKYITFLDSDDEYDPVHLESRKVILEENPSVRLLYGGVKIIGKPFVPDRFDTSRLINLNDCIIGGTFVIEREIALSLNGFRDISYGEDSDLFDRAKSNGVPALEVHRPTYIYHHETDESVTNRMAANL
jgi:glycosyltransferase involved in cell wall biosynthesis